MCSTVAAGSKVSVESEDSQSQSTKIVQMNSG